MKKILNIEIFQDPTKHVEIFLQDWQLIGSFENISELEYKLTSNDDMVCTLMLSEDQITISGNIPSKSFMLIDSLSKACEADKVLEGEFIDKDAPQHQGQNQQQNPFGNGQAFEMPKGMNNLIKITTLSKPKLILLLILTLPLLIIAIPIIIVVMIIKIIKFKLKF